MVTAAQALSKLARTHELVVTHGNGPQVGLLALQGYAYKPDEAFPLDVLGAETEGMIGYMIEQELGNLLPPEAPLATILTMIEVDAKDPAFDDPTKFIGPVYEKEQAETLAAEKGWSIRQDGDKWRRVVASPLPKRIFQIRPIKWLVDNKTTVICAGGGGIPTVYGHDGKLGGIDAVIDKDLASELLARELEADLLICATDVDAVYLNWDSDDRKAIKRTSPQSIREYGFASGSMGPKVEAACQFVEMTGKAAAIGALNDLEEIVAGDKGTTIAPDVSTTVFH